MFIRRPSKKLTYLNTRSAPLVMPRINRAHKWGANCVFFYAPNSFGPYDIAGQKMTTLTSGATYGQNFKGSALSISGTGDALFTGIPAYNVSDMTLLWAGIPTNFSNYRATGSKWNGLTGGEVFDSYLSTAGTGTLVFVRGNGAGGLRLYSAGAATAGAYNTIGWSASGPIEKVPGCVLNGTIQSPTLNFGSGTGAPASNSSPIQVASRADAVTQMLGTINFLIILNKAISTAEMLMALQDPFVMLQPLNLAPRFNSASSGFTAVNRRTLGYRVGSRSYY